MANNFSEFERKIARAKSLFTVQKAQAEKLKDLWMAVGYYLHCSDFREEALEKMKAAFEGLEHMILEEVPVSVTLSVDEVDEIIGDAISIRPAHRARRIILSELFSRSETRNTISFNDLESKGKDDEDLPDL